MVALGSPLAKARSSETSSAEDISGVTSWQEWCDDGWATSAIAVDVLSHRGATECRMCAGGKRLTVCSEFDVPELRCNSFSTAVAWIVVGCAAI
jgi:hypothetical protein